MQNFKKAIIQQRDPTDSAPKAKRHCRGAIRWYGKTDVGIIDVRDDVRLWGM